jgi:hypothetical protein
MQPFVPPPTPDRSDTMLFTVLLLCPEYASSEFGHDTYLVHVASTDVASAIEMAQKCGFETINDGSPEDWHVLFVIEGEHHDIKEHDVEKVSIPLTHVEIRALARILLNLKDDTTSNITANMATRILEKLRAAGPWSS